MKKVKLSECSHQIRLVVETLIPSRLLPDLNLDTDSDQIVDSQTPVSDWMEREYGLDMFDDLRKWLGNVLTDQNLVLHWQERITESHPNLIASKNNLSEAQIEEVSHHALVNPNSTRELVMELVKRRSEKMARIVNNIHSFLKSFDMASYKSWHTNTP